MSQIVWSPKSIRDLEAIQAYIGQYNPMVAKRLVQKIVGRTGRLERFPNSGGYVPEDDSRRYRQVLQGNYRVIYRYDKAIEVVMVVTVIHAARLLESGALDSTSG